jgi:hypothetical protein
MRGAKALAVLPSAMFGNHTGQIVALAAKCRVPAIYPEREYADDGGLLIYGRDVRRLFSRIATYVDRIMKGAKPADLPVEQPTKFELVVNLNTAKKLGLTIPPSILARADEIIEYTVKRASGPRPNSAMAAFGASSPLAVTSAKDRCPPKRSLVGTSRMRFEARVSWSIPAPPSVSLGGCVVTTLLKGAGHEARRSAPPAVGGCCRHSPTCRGEVGMGARRAPKRAAYDPAFLGASTSRCRSVRANGDAAALENRGG